MAAAVKALLAKLENASFLKKLFLSLLSISMAAIILVTTFLQVSYHHNVSALTHRFFQNLLSQSNYSITYMNELAERLASSLSYNRNVVSFLNAQETNSLQTVCTHREVNSIVLPLTYVDNVYLYNKKLDLMLDTKTGVQSTLDGFYDQTVARKLSVFDGAGEAAWVPFVHDSVYRGKTTSIYSYIFPDWDREGEMTSAYVINIRMDVLMKSLREINANNEYVKFVVAGPDGDFLSGSPFDDPEGTAQLHQLVDSAISTERSGDGQNAPLRSRKYLAAFTSDNSNGWYIFALIPRAHIFRDMITTTLVCLSLAILLAAACVLVSRKLARKLNHPVEVVTRTAQGETPLDGSLDALKAREFQYLASVLSEMREQKQEYIQYVDRTQDLVRQEFLEDFFCGMTVYTPQQVRPKLEALDCVWVLERPLRMCLFSIDNYADFAQSNTPRERWALRFAVINVATELLRKHFLCEMVQCSSNEFVAILDGGDTSSSLLESTLEEVLALIKTHLSFTLTAAYGTVFQDISHLSQMYENLCERLLLRICCGGGRVLTPLMAEDLEPLDLRVSSAVENTLVTGVETGNDAQSREQFDVIARELFQCDGSEVLPYLMHLSYRLFNSAKSAGASVQAQITEEYKRVSLCLSQCETKENFYQCFTDYVSRLCALVNAQKQSADANSSGQIVQRIIRIVESEYSQKGLCLSSIADELGLSAHYIGQVFRASQNKSVAKYIMDLRLEMIARELRETSRSFSEIMENAGLDPEQKNYIYTCFKKRFGVTVKNYRQQFSETTQDT